MKVIFPPSTRGSSNSKSNLIEPTLIDIYLGFGGGGGFGLGHVNLQHSVFVLGGYFVFLDTLYNLNSVMDTTYMYIRRQGGLLLLSKKKMANKVAWL